MESRSASPVSASSVLPPEVDLLNALIGYLVIAMIAWIVLSYIVAFGRVSWDHPIRKIYNVLSRVIEPILRPIRAIVPPIRIGGAALDLSPLILIIGLQLIQSLLR